MESLHSTRRPGDDTRLFARIRQEREASGEIPRRVVVKPSEAERASIRLYRQHRNAKAKREARLLAAAKREFEALLATMKANRRPGKPGKPGRFV